MDFMSRGGQTRTNNTASNAAPAAAAQPVSAVKSVNVNNEDKHSGHNKWTRIGFLILLFAGTILAVASLFFLAFGRGTYGESKLVDTSKMQAVFINVNGTNGGQVYFGKITDLTPSYIRLEKVFYIQNQQTSAQDTSAAYNLVKLGCELHGPDDLMVINRSEVFFWENLKSDSQVAQKVAEFNKQNPQGQKCNTADQQGQSTNQQSGNTQQTTTPSNSTAPKTTTPAPSPTPTTNNTNNNNEQNGDR